MRSRYLDVVTAVCELHVISTTRIHPDIDVSWIVEWRLSVTLLIRSRKTLHFRFVSIMSRADRSFFPLSPR